MDTLRRLAAACWLSLLIGALTCITGCNKAERSPVPTPDPTLPTDPGSAHQEVIVTGGRVHLREPQWRSSIRDPQTHESLDFLQRGSDFDLTVRFTWHSPGKNCEGEVGQPVSPQTDVQSGARVDLLVVADQRYFSVNDGRPRTVTISDESPDDSCDLQLADDNPPAASSVAAFALRSKSKRGAGAVLVVVYQRGRVVDLIPLKVCVECAEREPISAGNNADSYLSAIAAEAEDVPATDASILIFDFSEVAAIGVLAMRQANGEFTYATWPLADHLDEIRADLTETYAGILSRATDVDVLARKGEELARLLFRGDAGLASRQTLEQFLIEHKAATGNVPSLFVRIAGARNAEPLVFPIGLVAMQSVTDGSGFLGRHARIVMPLKEQKYAVPEECTGQILSLLPPANVDDPALKDARKFMGDELATRWSTDPVQSWNSTGSFEEWLLGDARAIDTAAAVFLLTHHYNGSIWIDKAEQMPADALEGITFHEPSWVVLNGCSTAATKASGMRFVEEFNHRGVQAIIATHSEVPAQLAGNYYRCLNAALTNAIQGEDLGQLHFEATECLWNMSSDGSGPAAPGEPRLGPNALKYALLGNPNLRICAAAKKE